VGIGGGGVADQSSVSRRRSWLAPAALALLVVSSAAVVGALLWAAAVAGGNPNPTDPEVARRMSRGAVVAGAGILVFREGLESILVLSAITASMAGANAPQRRPIAAGGGLALLATLATWFAVVAILNQVNAPETEIQAATGLLAVIVLLVVMNWFFHRVYWTGWIQSHNRRKRRLLQLPGDARQKLLLGLGLLGFASVYREGFEVVLFLQTLRLQTGVWPVAAGALVGLYLTATVGALTFVIHQRLPYRKMLVLTGVLLGFVLLVMVGEQVNEMQLAGWMTTTDLPGGVQFPGWAATWFSLYSNWETLLAMAAAAVYVLGSYWVAEELRVRRPRRLGQGRPGRRPDAPPGDAESVLALGRR
jgi:high-affinity iron transporter